MKKIIIITLSTLFIFASAIFAQESKAISLEQAIQTAIKNAPSIKIAIDQVEKSKAGVRESRANFFPQVSGTLTQMFQGPAMKINIEGIGDVNLVDSSNTSAKVTAVMPIDINDRLGYFQDLSKIQYFVDELNLNIAVRDLIFNVKESYYNLLRASAAMTATKKSLESANATLTNTRLRYEAGALAKFDVTRAETEVSNINQQYVASKNGVGVSRAALNNVLGISVRTPTQVEEITVSVNSEDKIDTDTAMKLAYNKREELKLADYRLIAAKKNVKIQRAGYLPSLALSADYQHSFKVSGFSASNDSWVAIANLNIPIWSGGVTKAKIDSASADVKSAEDSITQIKLAIGFGVEAASINLSNAAEKVSSTQKGVSLAEEALELANIRYGAGVSTLVEVLDSEAALYLARLNNVNSQFDYALAKAAMDKATASQPEFNNLAKQALSYK